MNILKEDTAMICGIDTLYYFVETNGNYDDMFLDILDQIEDKKERFEAQEMEYKNSDIFIELKNISLQFLNQAEGFYWFKDINEFFRVGFKDETKNKELHNIRVQLQGIGIYTIGLKTLVEFINDNLLKEIKTGFYPITRADINCFINYDFGFVDKNMFATRKKKYVSITEIGSAKNIQTIYVGKAPFMLRLYDKKLELEKSNKKEMMEEYFLNNGLDIKEPIFNIEFEMHRAHLKAYKITTLEDLLSNANNLFKKAMSDIRLIDLNTITQKDIKNNSKSRAETLFIWDYVKDNFNIDTFLQSEFSIQRLKRRSTIYDEDSFIEEFNKLIKKALMYRIFISPEFLSAIAQNYMDEAQKQKEIYKKAQEAKKGYIPVTIKGDNRKYRLLKSGKVITPVNVISFKELSNFELEKQIETLERELDFGEEEKRTDIARKLEVAYGEKMGRMKR